MCYIMNMSTLDALIAGSADATSLGFKDELTGLAGLLAGKFGLVPDLGYERYRDEARKRSEALANDNPYATLGSALLSGIAMGGAGLAQAPHRTQGSVGALASIGHSTGKPVTIDDLINSFDPYATSGMVGSMKRLKAPNLLSGKWDRPDMQVKDVSKLNIDQRSKYDELNPWRVGESAGGYYNPQRNIGFAEEYIPTVIEHEGVHALKDQISKKYPSGRNVVNIIDNALLKDIGVGKGGVSKNRFKDELLPGYKYNDRSDEEAINHLRDGHDGRKSVKNKLQKIDESILNEVIDRELFGQQLKNMSDKNNFTKAWNKKSKIYSNMTPDDLDEIAKMKDTTLDDLLAFINNRNRK